MSDHKTTDQPTDGDSVRACPSCGSPDVWRDKPWLASLRELPVYCIHCGWSGVTDELVTVSEGDAL